MKIKQNFEYCGIDAPKISIIFFIIGAINIFISKAVSIFFYFKP